MKLLGYIVSEQVLRADPDKVSAIVKMQAPDNLQQVRSFLGMAGYYRTCIANFAKISEPLVELTRKIARFKWNQQKQQAFDLLKTALACEQVMANCLHF